MARSIWAISRGTTFARAWSACRRHSSEALKRDSLCRGKSDLPLLLLAMVIARRLRRTQAEDGGYGSHSCCCCPGTTPCHKSNYLSMAPWHEDLTKNDDAIGMGHCSEKIPRRKFILFMSILFGFWRYTLPPPDSTRPISSSDGQQLQMTELTIDCSCCCVCVLMFFFFFVDCTCTLARNKNSSSSSSSSREGHGLLCWGCVAVVVSAWKTHNAPAAAVHCYYAQKCTDCTDTALKRDISTRRDTPRRHWRKGKRINCASWGKLVSLLLIRWRFNSILIIGVEWSGEEWDTFGRKSHQRPFALDDQAEYGRRTTASVGSTKAKLKRRSANLAGRRLFSSSQISFFTGRVCHLVVGEHTAHAGRLQDSSELLSIRERREDRPWGEVQE